MRSESWTAARSGARSSRPRRAFALAALFTGAGALALGAASPPAPITTTVTAPTFWTCTLPPALPAGAPGSAAVWITQQQGVCGENRLSGMRLSATHATGAGAAPGDVALGWVEAKGVVGRTTGASTACGDQKRPYVFSVPLWFKAPATEFHLETLCCESTFKGDSQTWVSSGPKPAGAVAVAQGELAAIAGGTAAQLNAALTQIRGGVSSIWGYSYEYDGCNPTAPKTKCKKVHCLDLEVFAAKPAPGGKATGTLVKGKQYDFDA